MSLLLRAIDYDGLNARQKENFNFMKVSALLADYGFSTMRLTDDWGGADFIAVHINGDSMKVQLKARLSICRKYLDKDIYVTFPYSGYSGIQWYLYPHDELCDALLETTTIGASQSWQGAGEYHFPRLGSKLLKFIAPYMLDDGRFSGIRRVPKSWLINRLTDADDEYVYAKRLFLDISAPSDELWFYDEPMPPDVLAGELGFALVRNGTVLDSRMTGVH